MDNALDERVADLELKLAVAEDHLDELDRVVFRQREQLDFLQDQLRELHRQLRALAPPDAALPSSQSDEPPPHY